MDINENHTTLKLFEFTCSLEELTNRIGLEPTQSGIKGQIWRLAAKPVEIVRTWPHNHWEYRVTKNESKSISDQIDEFVDEVLLPRIEPLKEIISSCEAELSVVQYYYTGCNPGLHFGNRRLKLISDIGLELDIDIYCLSADD